MQREFRQDNPVSHTEECPLTTKIKAGANLSSYCMDMAPLPIRGGMFCLTFQTSSKFQTRMILRKAFFDHSKITEEMVITYSASAYLSLPGASHALITAAEQMVPSNLEEISEQYKSINIPVLLIWGEKDEIVPLEVGRKLARNIPNSKLVVVPNCGHVPQEECPSQAIEAMESFLSYQTGTMK